MNHTIKTFLLFFTFAYLVGSEAELQAPSASLLNLLKLREGGLLPRSSGALKYCGALVVANAIVADERKHSFELLPGILTVHTNDLVLPIVNDPALLAVVLGRCKEANQLLSNEVEGMVMWHLIDNRGVAEEARLAALLTLLRAKQTADKLKLPHLKLDISADFRSPGVRNLSFTAYLQETVLLSQFPGLAVCVEEYEAQRNAYMRQVAIEQQFAYDQMELLGWLVN